MSKASAASTASCRPEPVASPDRDPLPLRPAIYDLETLLQRGSEALNMTPEQLMREAVEAYVQRFNPS